MIPVKVMNVNMPAGDRAVPAFTLNATISETSSYDLRVELRPVKIRKKTEVSQTSVVVTGVPRITPSDLLKREKIDRRGIYE